MNDMVKAREEAKRERCWNPIQRWQAIQDTITWAEAQATVRRNTPSACLAHERRLLQQRETVEKPANL